MIEVKGLTKHFGSVQAVNQISFRVKGGEIFGLLGENGAGKTTTLRMLATVLKPTSGSATVNGFDLVREPDRVRTQIGVLSAEEGCYPRLTARENIEFFARLNNLPPDEVNRRTEEVIELLDMGEYADRRTGDFSKGMKQKVALARAIVHDPPILLMDEPTAGLDVTSTRVVRDFLVHCRQQGRAIIFSSHIMSEVERLCDRVAIINRGRIVAEGTLQELTTQYGEKDFEEVFARLVGGSTLGGGRS